MVDAQSADGDAKRFGDRQRSFPVRIRQDRRELLAAVAGGEITRPVERRGQHFRHSLQAVVSRGVAVGIVERLEVVDVDQQQAQRRSMPLAPPEFVLDRLVEGAAVGEAREPVEPRELLEAPVQFGLRQLGAFPFCDVGDDVEIAAVGGEAGTSVQPAPIGHLEVPFAAASQR